MTEDHRASYACDCNGSCAAIAALFNKAQLAELATSLGVLKRLTGCTYVFDGERGTIFARAVLPDDSTGIVSVQCRFRSAGIGAVTKLVPRSERERLPPVAAPVALRAGSLR